MGPVRSVWEGGHSAPHQEPTTVKDGVGGHSVSYLWLQNKQPQTQCAKSTMTYPSMILQLGCARLEGSSAHLTWGHSCSCSHPDGIAHHVWWIRCSCGPGCLSFLPLACQGSTGFLSDGSTIPRGSASFASAYPASACITCTDVTWAKANHMTQPSINVGGASARAQTQGKEVRGVVPGEGRERAPAFQVNSRQVVLCITGVGEKLIVRVLTWIISNNGSDTI